MNDLKLNEDRETLKRILERAIPQTLQDVVLIYASVMGMRGGALFEENYVKKIKEELGITRIMALGFFDEKELPHYLHTKLNFDAFCLKDLNWYRIPHGNTVQNFIAEEYDILIDLTLRDHLPLQYIVAKSKARFKVGRLSDSNAHFLDMMIDTAGAHSLPQLIANIDRYLMMINAKEVASLN